MRPAGAADARRSLAGPLAVAVVAEALGLGDIDPAAVLDWYAAIVGTVTDLAGEPAAAGPVGAAGAAAFGMLSARLSAVIEGAAVSTEAKSITVTLIFRSPAATLTSEQVEGAVQKTIAAAQQKLGATLRV